MTHAKPQAPQNLTFEALCETYFSRPGEFARVARNAIARTEKSTSDEACAIAGYVSYLREDFARASRFFLEAIERNPDRLDHWLNLAFSLRHEGEMSMSQTILFHFDIVVPCYKIHRRSLCGFRRLKAFLKLVEAHEH